MGAHSDADVGEALGLKQQTISAAKSKKQIPAGWIVSISQSFGISSDWLLYGVGPMRLGAPALDPEPVTPQPGRPAVPQACDPEIMLIPKVKARLSAGGGSLETNDEVVGLYAFRKKFLKRKGQPGQMVLMDVSGDSMEPEMKSGDTVLIDESQTEIIAGRIYAVGLDEEVVVKVVDKVPGKIILRSFNKEFPPIEVNMLGDLSDGVRIIGRVIWWCREAR